MRNTVQRAYTPSELTGEIKRMLEGSYPEITLEGEVSNFRPASSGHWYFVLKDAGAMIQAVMFRGAQRGATSIPADGQKVVVRGNISVYSQRGSYQIICTQLETAGQGTILQILEERKRRLAAEGIFENDRKRALPRIPSTVAVLTSETGAAVRDFIRVIQRRARWMNVIVVNIPVQGEGAGDVIAQRIAEVDAGKYCDVMVITRGGGSIEDLLPFSDEAVVRAVAECQTPLISAIGHEIDWALSDFAADLRAPTPSAAAEMLCANSEELLSRVMGAGRIIVHSFLERRTRLRLAIKPFGTKTLGDHFRRMLQPKRIAVDDARERLLESVGSMLKDRKGAYSSALRELKAVDPFAILNRGYAVVRDQHGQVVPGAKEAAGNPPARIQFRDGEYDLETGSATRTNTED